MEVVVLVLAVAVPVVILVSLAPPAFMVRRHSAAPWAFALWGVALVGAALWVVPTSRAGVDEPGSGWWLVLAAAAAVGSLLVVRTRGRRS